MAQLSTLGMSSMRLMAIVSAALMAVCVVGCVHGTKPDAARHSLLFTVSLPPLKLAENEYIQSVDVTIYGGRIATVNRTWDDWNISIGPDSNPDDWVCYCEARHFSNGFSSTHELDRFITVKADLAAFDIRAAVTTERAGVPDLGEKVYHLSRAEFILNPRPGASVWRQRAAFDHAPESHTYIVQWDYDAMEIGKRLHLTEAQLSLLNPGVDLSQLKVGQVLNVSAQVRK